MHGYLQKFNQLPENIKKKVSSPETMQAISEIEKKYNINLATLIIRVLIQDISISNLHKSISYDNLIDDKSAKLAVGDLKEKVFYQFKDFLDIGDNQDPGRKMDSDYAWLAEKNKDKANGARFFFSTEDEEEVEKYAKMQTPNNDGYKSQVEAKINKIVSDLKISFSSEMLKNRLENMLSTYLRGIRSRVITRDNFLKPVEAGGLGLSEANIDKILSVAEKYKDIEIAEEEPRKEQALLAAGVVNEKSAIFEERAPRDVAYDFSKLKSAIEKKEEEEKEGDKINESAVENVDKADTDKKEDFAEKDGETIKIRTIDKEAVNSKNEKAEEAGNEEEERRLTINLKDSKSKTSAKNKENKEDEEVEDEEEEDDDGEEEEVPNLMPINILNVNRMSGEGKIKMHDVKQVKTKLMSPVDELGEMDLVNFRRLGKDAEEMAKKIEEKINFLEDENYSKRLEGIKAWRNSPVNELYLKMGRESIEKNKSIEEISAQMRDLGKDHLTINEINAIMNLNRRLRY
jgi:hypothetical protein